MFGVEFRDKDFVESEIDVEPNIFAPAVRSFGLGFTAR